MYVDNKYFSTVFTKETFDSFPTMNRVTEEKLCDIQCSVDEVEQYLNNINVSKSPGPDNILPRILKECASAIAPSLTSIFNRSWSSGKLPEDWKLAHIIPIPKKNSKFRRDNYRQVSLTSKIAEKIIRDRSIEFWLRY
jgi:hypothetical protein